jgi:hypothetical protein
MASARAAEKVGWWRFYQLPVAVASKSRVQTESNRIRDILARLPQLF